jgi:hypothetical protein
MTISPQSHDVAVADAAGQAAEWRAVAELHHAYLTGLLLMIVSRRGRFDAAELVFRTFRRQHLEKFLPGLEKLGLSGLPDAVACAQYHYLSNHLGGVKVQYMHESDRKAWVRYPPPRWIFSGTAICGIPSEVSRAMLRGWHAHNGVTLGNERLGFVCTKQTVDGQPGLEGYYLEHERALSPDERLAFRPGEQAPLFRPADAPVLPTAGWPHERLLKAERNYAMDYVRTILPLTMELFGPAEGAHLAGLAARQIGMHYGDRMREILGCPDTSFPGLLARLLRGQGDRVRILDRGSDAELEQQTWRLMHGVEAPPPEVFASWSQLFAGMLAAEDPRRSLRREIGGSHGPISWSVR